MNNKKYTLLIIDNKADISKHIADVLRERYNVLTAGSGEEALAVMREKSDSIDAVLLDMDMPEMEGRRVLKIMSGEEGLRSIPVIAVITDNGDETEDSVLELGAADYVSRPANKKINVKTLEKRVESVLRQRELKLVHEENERLKKGAESEMHLSALMDNLPGGVAIIETDGKTADCTYFNNAVLKLFHMKSREFLNEFEKEEASDWLKTFIEKAGKGGNTSYSFSVNMGRQGIGWQEQEEEKQWIRVSASGMGRTNGRLVMYCVFLDINAEKRQEQIASYADKKLHENEARMENMMNNAPGALALFEEDENGELKVLYCSKGLADIMGYSDYELYLSELMEAPTARTENPDEVSEFRRALGAAAMTGKPVEQVFRCRDYNNNSLWLMMRCRLMRGEKGRTTLYGIINDITKEKEYEQELKISVYYDSLTGLYNRNAFYSSAKQLLRDNPNTVYLAMRFNIGSFKLVNDLMGRETGDKVLITIADILRGLIPECGIYARFFSDHFLIMIPEGEIEPEIILGTIKREIAEREIIPHDVQYYIGIYRITDRETSVEDICDRAAMACRSITGSFKQYVSYYDERMREEMLEEQEICDQAHRAIANNEFCIYYQSVYGIKAKKFVSAEALVRWNHPEKGLISPGKFIPIFEKNGFIAELDLYVLEQVCKYQKKRREQGLQPFPISVNISRMSLYNPKLYDIINDLTKKYGVDPRYFRIEITESAYNDNPGQLLETVRKLRERSYPVLMDDFGSGYSSLNTLKDIPIDMLKLDMKFMQDFEKNGRVGTIVTSVARMSKWLNLPMLAEGVETKEQYDFLESIGCSYIQGYLFAKPSSEDVFTDLISHSEVNVPDYKIESYGIDDSINELLGNSGLVSKLIGSIFGGLGIYEMSSDRLEVIRVNEGYMQIMGYTPDDFTGEHYNIWDKLHPDDVEKSKEACLEAAHTGKAVRAVVRRYNRSGELIYLEGSHRRLGGDDENPIFCIAFNDITEQIETDRIIRQSKDRIGEILNATGAIVIDADVVNDTAFCSGNMEEYGFTADQLSQLIRSEDGFSELVHPDQHIEMLKYHNANASERVSKEFLLKSSDGEYRWVRFTKKCSYDDSGKLLRVMGTISNIDAEKRTEAALEETRLQIQTAMENIGAGIIFFEIDTATYTPKIKFSNKGFWKLVGKEPDPDYNFIELIKKGISKKESAEIGKKTLKGETNRFVFRLTRDDGSASWVELTCTPTDADPEGKSNHMIILSDITERYLNSSKLEAIVGNYNDGLALVSRKNGDILLSYANEKFCQILGMDTENENVDEIHKTLSHIIDYHYGSTDTEIPAEDGRIRIVKTRAIEFESGVTGEENYVVTAEDVTLRRREAVNRIAERSAYAATGIYNAVYKIDYKDKISTLIFSRLGDDAVNKAKPVNIEYLTCEWIDKKIHPDDRSKMKELLTEPEINADFTDMYAQIRMQNPYSSGADDEYKHFGMAMVKAGRETCMLFLKDLERIDDSHTSAEFAAIGNLYQLVAEQTHTTVIEYNHITGKVTSSPSLKLYAAGNFTDEQLSQKENYSKGLIVHPDDLKKFKNYLNEINSSSSEESLTIRLKMADDSYKWCRITVYLTKDAEGKIIKSLCTLNDVHEEVEARKKADQADYLMRKTIRNIPVGVGIYRLENNFLIPIYVSDNTREIFGLKDGVGNVDTKALKDFMENNIPVPGTENDITVKIYRKDGSSFWINSKYTVREENGEIIVYSAVTDVTEKIAAQRMQSVKDRIYRMLLNETGTVIFYYDVDNDEFAYHQPMVDPEGGHTVIYGFMTDTDKMTLLEKEDREKFIEVLSRLCKSEKETVEELDVQIVMNGLPKHFRCFFMTVCGSDGRITRIIGKMDDVDEEVTRFEAVRAKAMYDSLCVDIYNKSTTEELIKAKLKESHSGALLMIDVDDFKSINDRLGHMFGDEFLKSFATAIKREFRDSDIVGRYGGDEFCVFIGGVTYDATEKKCVRLLAELAKIEIPEIGSVKSSIGAALVTEENREYRQILNQADSALYVAKNRGKNRFVLFDPNTMNENNYRAHEAIEHASGKSIVLSSNPDNFLSLIMRIFSALYSDSDIEKGIEQMLGLIGKTFDVSRVYIFEDNKAGTHCSNTFEWCNSGIEPEIDNLKNISYEEDLGGCYHENFNDDNIFYCHDINTLCDNQRDILVAQGIKSMLQCAIMDGGVFKGYIGFDECRSNRFWTKEQIDALVFISKIISVFLLRDRTRRKNDAEDGMLSQS